jgi:hypothetical protein
VFWAMANLVSLCCRECRKRRAVSRAGSAAATRSSRSQPDDENSREVPSLAGGADCLAGDTLSFERLPYV